MKKVFAFLAPMTLFCNPQGADVVSGSASFHSPQENLLQIEVSDRAVIGWDSFSIDAGETTRFLQPGPLSSVLNRVSGGDPSSILGSLQANGQVYLINPNGLLVGKDAVIDTSSFIASSFDLLDEEFLAGGDIHFSGESQASLINCGTILAPDGSAILIGYLIDNQGSMTGQSAVLAAAKEVVLTHADNQLLSVRIPLSEANALQNIASEIEENPFSLAIQIDHREQASQLVEQGERLLLTGAVFQTGKITAEHLAIYGEKCISGGSLTAASEISIDAGANYVETSLAALIAPSISIQAEGRLFTSGNYMAEEVTLLGKEIVLAAAEIDASGSSGGHIFIEGSSLLEVTGPSSIKADALLAGDGGKIVLLSDGTTRFSGSASAKGGSEGGNGGFIEISGHDLHCRGSPNVRAPHGDPGTLLLDPFDIIIDVVDPGGGFPYYDLIDPTQGSGSGFGSLAVLVTSLTNGNVVVPKIGDNTMGTNAGAVYLYNGLTGALISTLYGSHPDDQIGLNGTQALTNGNFVVQSTDWNSLTGAATWGNGATGFNGSIVSSSNSIVGSTPGDQVGFVTALTNGNYVVRSPPWTDTTTHVAKVGAATWGDGATGTFGPVAEGNSIYGLTLGDNVGTAVVALTNGNYVILSPAWTDTVAGVPIAGAATWADGSGPTSAVISETNSLYGFTTSDNVGGGGAVALTNGNYVVLSPNFNDGTPGSTIGAATWGDGTSGTTGQVNGPSDPTPNSIVGSNPGDQVGSNGAIALTNGNYVVLSPLWNGNIGAATWGSGSSSTSLTVSGGLLHPFGNSLVGENPGDEVGFGAIALTNGNYVVLSPLWNGNIGAATFVYGTIAIPPFSFVSNATSITGTTAGDEVGLQAIALTNGNYVVLSPDWNNGVAGANVGAATWAVGTAPTATTVSTANSLFGTFPTNGLAPGDQVGLDALALVNGNYVVLSSDWNNSAAFASVGAATWGNGSTGITGPVTTSNSLFGVTPGTSLAMPGDSVGTNGRALANGNYVVGSTFQNGISGSHFCAVTWGNGATGITGPVTTDNSVVGLTPFSGVELAVDNPNTSPPTFLQAFPADNISGRIAVSLDDPTLLPYEFGAYENQNVTISPGFVAEILNAGSSLTLQALNDINFNSPISVAPTVAVGLTGMANNNININADIVTTNGPLNLTLIANQNVLSTSTVTVNAGSGNIILVCDNANPTPPEIGTGYVSIPNATLTTTGKVQIFTAIRSLNTEPGPINGVPFVPGPLFVDSATEQWGVYFPNSFGGVPYTIFYKQFFSVADITKSYVHFLTEISNTDNSLDQDVDWITFVWNYFSEEMKLVTKRKGEK